MLGRWINRKDAEKPAGDRQGAEPRAARPAPQPAGPRPGGAAAAAAQRAPASAAAGAPKGPAAQQARPRPAPAPVPAQADEEGDATPLRAPGRGVPAVAAAAVPVPAGARPAQREPTPEDLQALESFSGRVLTGDGGRIEVQAGQRKFVAALDNDVLVIAKDHLASAQVSAVRTLLSRSGFRPRLTLLADLETVRKVYEAEGRRSGSQEHHRDTVQMQRMVIDLIRGAARERCSDIHIIVKRHEAEIRVRSDGVMMKLKDLPSASATDLCQAAFNMADASDASYKPFEYQGARITSLKTSLPDGVQAVRLQFNPLPDNGRYLIARLLYAQKVGSTDDVDQLGYTEHQIRQIKRMRRKPSGINIIAGPTGSGKSTTLQRSLGAGLREVNYEKNVITVEDPPEYEITGAAQLPVTNVKTEQERREAFRQAITASLRSDPDIVMIGEIRDGASAQLAFQASMTGHQVWASLHANDALSILDRLRDMEVELYRLSDYTLVTGLIGQRLVRRLCQECRLPWSEGVRRRFLSEENAGVVARLAGEAKVGSTVFFANPDGCEKCRVGYAGRTVVAEVILPDRKFMEHIGRTEKIQAYEYWLKNLAGVTMLENAMLKVCEGLVDPREAEDKVGLLDEIDADRFPGLLSGKLLEIVKAA